MFANLKDHMLSCMRPHTVLLGSLVVSTSSVTTHRKCSYGLSCQVETFGNKSGSVQSVSMF